MTDVQIALLWLAIATALGFCWGWIARGTLAEYRKYKAATTAEDAGEVEHCESGDPECGPVEHHDSEGVPLCAKCWQSLLDDATTQPEDAA